MAFCTNCGSAFDDNSDFCPYCGARICVQNDQQPQPQPQYQQPQPQYQYQQPQQLQYQQPQLQYQQPQSQYQQPQFQSQIAYYAKPRIPGKGFGITSMILGIVSSAALTFLLIVSIVMSDEGYHDDDGVLFIVLAVIYGIVAVLSIVFALIAFSKGFKRGQSLTGLILGCCAMLFLIISIILFATAEPSHYNYYDYYYKYFY